MLVDDKITHTLIPILAIQPEWLQANCGSTRLGLRSEQEIPTVLFFAVAEIVVRIQGGTQLIVGVDKRVYG